MQKREAETDPPLIDQMLKATKPYNTEENKNFKVLTDNDFMP